MTQLARYDVDFSATQIAIVKEVICPGISDAQLAMFSSVCKLKRLDPFSRQIYATLRYDKESGTKKLSIQTGIDGFRLIAERTEKYGGQEDFEWCGQDGKWVEVWLAKDPPAAARATVLRKDWPKPFRRVARWSAYFQDRSPMWQKMGAEQLAKCAEALALRGAFPEELSGLYTDDEMDQATEQPRTTVTSTPQPQGAIQGEYEEPGQYKPGLQPKHYTYWFTGNKYRPNAEGAGVDIRTLENKSLSHYIERLEKSAAAKDKWSETAQLYLNAATHVLEERTLAEADKAAARQAQARAAGADPATGEIPASQLEAEDRARAERQQELHGEEREPGDDGPEG